MLRWSHFIKILALLIAVGILPIIAAAQQREFSLLDFEASVVNKKMLLTVSQAKGYTQMLANEPTIRLADRDIQRLYYTKLYQLHPTNATAKRLLELMPQGQLETLHFYVYTELDADTFGIGISAVQEASDLYYQYYGYVSKLLPKHRKFLERYLVMLRWVSDNAEVAELIEDWEPPLEKAFGPQYQAEKKRIWDVLNRPYDSTTSQ